jgi:hypothetical protein
VRCIKNLRSQSAIKSNVKQNNNGLILIRPRYNIECYIQYSVIQSKFVILLFF